MRKLGTIHTGRREKLRAAGGDFYQFAFSRREISAASKPTAFRVLSFHPYDPARMLRPDPWPANSRGRRAEDARPRTGRRAGRDRRGRGPVLRRLAVQRASCSRMCAHMILAVAVRP